MSDLIRRKDAVSRMSDLLIMELKGQRLPTWNEVYQAINDVPSVEPERTAKFRRDGDFLRCSKCWRIVDSGYNYCPNCGAKLDWSE